MASLAGAAFADSIPPLSPGPAASLPNQSAQTQASGAGAIPANLSGLLNPGPAGSPQLIGHPFRADASMPPSTAPAPGPLGLSWQGPNLLGDMWGFDALNAKGNFRFERTIGHWRDGFVLDLRRKR
jgi:hypothetical protein